MSTRRPRWVVVALIALSCLVPACPASARAISTSSAVGPARGSSQARAWSVVALGDSVPRGTNCDCEPYPGSHGRRVRDAHAARGRGDQRLGRRCNDLLGSQAAREQGRDPSLAGGARRRDRDRRQRRRLFAVVRHQDFLLRAAGTNGREEVAAIVGRVRELTSRHHALIVLLDYWSVWLGGKYAAAKGNAYVAAAEEMTDQVNTVIKSTAADTGSAYVDLRAAFKVPITPTTRRTTSPMTAITRTRPGTRGSRRPPKPWSRRPSLSAPT